MPMPLGYAPPIPGVSRTEGMPPGMPPTGLQNGNSDPDIDGGAGIPGSGSPGGLDPMTMLALALGTRPQGTQMGSGDKMAQVVQLLREVAESDPRIGSIASGALQVLIQGPPGGAAPPGQPPIPPGGAPMGPAPGGMVMPTQLMGP